jgi:hypothetical protein
MARIIYYNYLLLSIIVVVEQPILRVKYSKIFEINKDTTTIKNLNLSMKAHEWKMHSIKKIVERREILNLTKKSISLLMLMLALVNFLAALYQLTILKISNLEI